MDTSLEKEVKKEFLNYLNCYGFLGICYLSVSLSLSAVWSPKYVETVKVLKAQVVLLETGSYVNTCICHKILLIILRSLAVSLLLLGNVNKRKILTYV